MRMIAGGVMIMLSRLFNWRWLPNTKIVRCSCIWGVTPGWYSTWNKWSIVGTRNPKTIATSNLMLKEPLASKPVWDNTDNKCCYLFLTIGIQQSQVWQPWHDFQRISSQVALHRDRSLFIVVAVLFLYCWMMKYIAVLFLVIR